MHRLQELVRLHRLGKKVREITVMLKMGRSTEQKYRSDQNTGHSPGWLEGQRRMIL